MIDEGHEAPPISLPAYHDGEVRTVDLADYLGDGIVVLAFYPADFNPACSSTESDLGDLDLLTMQKDVSLFAVSPDSVYSHEQFATQYGLHLPLLADTRGEAAETYGVERDVEGQRLARRAVFVVDHHGIVQYAWATDDISERFDHNAIKTAVGDIGGDETAFERYREGYDHYADGREAFTEAMAEYEDREWMAARPLFDQAHEAFNTALDQFDTAVRFAETAELEAIADRSHDKASDLDHAADWLNDSADAFATGHGDQGTAYREDAQQPMAGAKALPDPADPGKFTLEDDGVTVADDAIVEPEDTGEDDGYDWRKDDEQSATASLDEDELAAVDDSAQATDAESPADGSDDGIDGSADGSAPPETDGETTTAGATTDDSANGATVEGDTVEGDIELDLDADAATSNDSADGTTSSGEAEGTDGGTQAGGSTQVGADNGHAEDDDPDVNAAPGDNAVTGEQVDGQTAEAGDDTSDATDGEASGVTDPDPGQPADSDTSDTVDGDTESESVELDLADPTESKDDEEETDERENWDIPGQ